MHPLSRHHQIDNEDIWKQTSNKTTTLILCVESAGSVLWLCLCMRGEGGTSWRTRPPSALGGGGISRLVSQPHCQEIKRASHRQRARREPKRIRPLPAEPFSHLEQRYEARLWSVTKEQCSKSRFVSLPRRISIVDPRNGSWEEKELANTLNFTLDHCLCNIHCVRHTKLVTLISKFNLSVVFSLIIRDGTVYVFVPNRHGTDISVRCMRPYDEYRQFTPNPEGGARSNETLFGNRQQKNSECRELRASKQSSLDSDHVLILNASLT